MCTLLYGVVAGIEVDPAEPGYKHVLIEPQAGGGLTCARATLDSPYGKVSSAWELSQTGLHLRIVVPPNAHATVRLPVRSLDAVGEGGQPLAPGNGILSAHAGKLSSQQLDPTLLESPDAAWVLDMPLAQLAVLAPHVLSPEKLDVLEAAL